MQAIEALKQDYDRPGGLQMVEVAGGFQIVTRPELHEWVRRLFHERTTQKLSVAALETLAVIAYRQPVTAPEIAEIRGVNTAGVVGTLVERRLVKVVGRKQVVGRPFLYGTSREFLDRFGLNDLTDLPKVEDMSDILGFDLPSSVGEPAPQSALPFDATVGARRRDRLRRPATSRTNTSPSISHSMPAVRLNKLLSQLGIASRRTADTLIATGRVDVNGHPVTELGTKVDPERDDVRVDGRRLRSVPERRYFLIYKPKGVVSTRADPQRGPPSSNCFARAGVRGYFFPVGRLDYESEGLMILTNDGDFAQRVAHPHYELARTYEIHVAGIPDDRDLERLRRGIVIDGGRTQPTTVRLIRVLPGGEEGHAILEMTLARGAQSSGAPHVRRDRPSGRSLTARADWSRFPIAR